MLACRIALLLGVLSFSLPGYAAEAGAGAGADIAAGKRLFATCASCHQVGRYASGAYGPQLNGIVGRAAGSTTDFHYSPAMKGAPLVWTEKNLAAFLRSPDTVVPGNKMRFWGISDEQQLANLLAYLRTLPLKP